jgi:group I intron endonuclease
MIILSIFTITVSVLFANKVRLMSSFLQINDVSLYSSEWFMHRLGMSYQPAFVMTYNSFTQLKLAAYNPLKKIGGIYAIYCKTEDKVYVGSSVAFYKRLSGHFNVPASSSKNIQAALLKYGKDDFYILILDNFGHRVSFTKKKLEMAENSYLHRLDPDFMYNVKLEAFSLLGFKHSPELKLATSKRTRGDGNPFYGHKHSPGSRKVMSEAKMGLKNSFFGRNHTKDAIALMIKNHKTDRKKSGMYGKKHTPETIALMQKVIREGEGRKGPNNPFYGQKQSEETKALLSAATKKRLASSGHPLANGVLFSNVLTGEVLCFNTIKDTVAHFKMSAKTI